jgi:hypothetical protein
MFFLRSVWKNLTGLWDELECRLWASPNRPPSVPNLTNALVAEWKQVPTAMVQHLVESLPRRVKAVIAAKGGTNSMLMSLIFEWYVWREGVRYFCVYVCVRPGERVCIPYLHHHCPSFHWWYTPSVVSRSGVQLSLVIEMSTLFW